LIVGTPSFSVRISYACSGIEGVSLIVVFLALYCWLFRKALRFPQAFWLFPIGVVSIWLANVVRIAALFAIGASISPDIALGGFHAEAGWVAFTLIALAAVAMSHRLRFFTTDGSPATIPSADRRLAAALLVPLMALMGTAMVTSLATSSAAPGLDPFYFVRVLTTGIGLWFYRESYRGLGWSVSWHSAIIGGCVFLVWILFEPSAMPSVSDLTPSLVTLPPEAIPGWLVLRIMGAVIAVPLAEELAFRGYLLRKLISDAYETVPLHRFTWFSFTASSAAFGLLHGERWLAGTLAGMGFALAMYRRGHIGDAVAAHATANGLLSIWVITRGRWDLWS